MRHFLPLLLFCFSTAYSQSNCDNYSKDYIPKDLNDALTYLNCKWTERDKVDFRNQPEEEAVKRIQFGTGRWIEKGWNLWQGKNSLVRYFNSIGIYYIEGMSSIIWTSFHRQLNKKDIDLNGQVKFLNDNFQWVSPPTETHLLIPHSPPVLAKSASAGTVPPKAGLLRFAQR